MSIGVNAAGDAGDVSPAISGQPGTKSSKCLISPPKFVKIVIKLPAELHAYGATSVCGTRKTPRHPRKTVIVLILHEL